MSDTTKLNDDLSSLTVLEAADLAKMLEEKWGVSAAAAIAVAAGPAGGAPAVAVEEQTEFTVVLAAAGDRKIEVIKEVRAITGLGLKEAKHLVESAPTVLKEGISRSEASRELVRLSATGAQILLVRAEPTSSATGVKTDSNSNRQPATNFRLRAVPTSSAETPKTDSNYRRPVIDFRREAESIGVPVEPPPDRSEAIMIVWKIAGSASDLFPEENAARNFLFDQSIDDSGRTAVDLVRERGATALLIKLDQMRFGANG